MAMLQGQVQSGIQQHWDFRGQPLCGAKPESRETLHQAELTEDPVCSVLLESLSFFLDVLRGYCHTVKSNRCQLDYLFFSSPHPFLTSLTHRLHDSATVWVIRRKNGGVCTGVCLVPIVHQVFIPHKLYALFLMASLRLIPPPFISAFMHVIWRCTFKCQYLF